jgi:hypothetical protein
MRGVWGGEPAVRGVLRGVPAGADDDAGDDSEGVTDFDRVRGDGAGVVL